MPESNILLYIASLLTSLFGLALGLIALSYRKLIKKYFELKKEKEQIERDIQAKKDKIYDNARKEALEIVQKAEFITEDTRQQLTQELKNVTSEQMKSYEQTLEKGRQEILNVLQSVSQDIKQSSLSEMDRFKAMLVDESKKSQHEIETAIQNITKNLENELEGYKKTRMQQVDSQILSILNSVSKQVIGKSLDRKDHEDLIIKALEDAKKRNMFD